MTDNDKRERIIAAAYDVLSTKGYDRASTKEIAAAAGVAQGLINYYFPSKDQLFAEVVRRETDRYCRVFDGLRAYGAKALGEGTIAEILDMPKMRAIDEPEMFQLRYELSAYGLRQEGRRLLRDMLAMKRDYIAGLVQSITGLPKREADALGGILYGIFEGLGLQKVADDDFDYDHAYKMLADILGAYMKQAGIGRQADPAGEAGE